jgi:hypothetical protein
VYQTDAFLATFRTPRSVSTTTDRRIEHGERGGWPRGTDEREDFDEPCGLDVKVIRAFFSLSLLVCETYRLTILSFFLR